MISCVKNVQLLNSSGDYDTGNVFGTLHILGTHFVFKADSIGKEIWVVHTLIASVDKSPASINGSRLTIRCKHFLVLVFLLPKDRDCQIVFETLTRCSRVSNVNELFAFIHKNDQDGGRFANSWKKLDWGQEFRRQGVNENWKESDLNRNYAYCDTYPERLWFPNGATTQMLIGSCKFRSKARLPALTYFYRQNAAAICRSSQPLSGFSARCMEDECLIEMIMSANPSSTTLFLIDTRPRVNAMVNKVQGKGFEDSRNYTNIQFHFFDIENIHIVRTSLNKLLEACQKPQSITQYLKTVENSGWLKHLRILLVCGNFIAQSVIRGITCLVHCSDGWDRTSQTVSLAQLILDPFYRTLKGFQVLIDKDWLGFGFKFDDRCGHVGTLTDENEREVSPIFTQFLDATYQLMRTNPLAFEFNEPFLLELNEHAYSCLYGQFIGNCDKDREDLRIMARTKSLWSYMNTRIDEYKNPFYKPGVGIFLNDNEPQHSSLAVWSAMYNRFDSGIQPREYFLDTAACIRRHVNHLNGLMGQSNMDIKRHSTVWQSGVGVNECSNPKCAREFLTRFELRTRCHCCGKVYCHQCCKMDQNKGGARESGETKSITCELCSL